MPKAVTKERARPRVPWVAVVSLASLLASAWLLSAPGERSQHGSVDADGYSRSAIGHLGLIRLLRALGENAVQMRSARGLGECSLLVLAEPDTGRGGARHVERWIGDAPATLVVLPKRTVERDADDPTRVLAVELVPSTRVGRVLGAVAEWTGESDTSMRRVGAVREWTVPTGWPVPQLPAPVQLLADAPHVEPIVHCADGVLLGNVGGVYVLADPDLIANHGLLRGDNAAIAIAMLRRLRQGDGAIVFDETLHGHQLEPSVFHLARRFPYALIAVHLLLLAALIAWIAAGRFGPVLPVAAAIGAGKAFLIDNVAALLGRGGHHGESLRRYGKQRVRLAADALHAPPGLDDERCRDFLLARVRDASRRDELQALLRDAHRGVPAARAVATARRLRDLTEEMLHAGR